MSKTRMVNQTEDAYLGSLIEKLFSVAHDLENDDNYSREDAVNDLLDMVSEIGGQIAMKNF